MRKIDPEGKKVAILDAALSEFAAKGFHGASVGGIAKAASVSIGTLYRIFDSKEGLANKTLQRSIERFGEFRTDHLDQDIDPRVQFGSIVGPTVALYQNYPLDYIFSEVQFLGLFIDDTSKAMIDELYKRSLAWAESMKKSGVLKNYATELLVSIVRGSIINLIKSSIDENKKITAKNFKDLEQLCWDAVAA